MNTRGDDAGPTLSSYGDGLHVAVIGASGGIGDALAQQLEDNPAIRSVFRLGRSFQPARAGKTTWLPLDLGDKASIAKAATAMHQQAAKLNAVIVATGVLHDGNGLQPEKTWRTLDAAALETAFRINTVGPALVAKHVLPLLAKDRKSVFAALSARVGSIGDNQLGGWHAYRASKAALNMIIKTLAIELARRNPHALCIGLHPGTVDTALSKPFQSGVATGKLFAPVDAARHLLNVLNRLTPDDSGGVFAWDGAKIAP